MTRILRNTTHFTVEMGASPLFLAFLFGLFTQIVTSPPHSDCSGGKVFSDCGTPCPLSCDNFREEFGCAAVCVEGCFCPEGQVEHNGGCVAPEDCSDNSVNTGAVSCERANGGCREDQVCEVVTSRAGCVSDSDCDTFVYVNCKDPPYVLCSADTPIACDSESLYCLQQNRTHIPACVASCLSDNGGCGEDQVCTTTEAGDIGGTRLQCLDADGLSSECPAGQRMDECGDHCQLNCEQSVTGEQFACAAFCGPPACACPEGLVLFRDRCVDPRLCYVLLNYPPAINPLPIVDANQYLYSLLSPGTSKDDFLSSPFLEAVSQVLRSHFPDVNVDLHGIYEDNGLQIVVVLSGEAVTEDTSDQFVVILEDNSDQLPIPIEQISLVDADRVEKGGFWTTCKITILSVAGGVAVLLALLVAFLCFPCCNKFKKKNRTQPEKLNVEIHNLMAEEELPEKGRLEFESS